MFTNFDESKEMINEWKHNNLEMFKKHCNIVFDKIIQTRKTKYVSKWVHFIIVFNMNPNENKIGNYNFIGIETTIPLKENDCPNDIINILHKIDKTTKNKKS